MAVTLTAQQVADLIAQYASGITEVEIPGDKRIRYADPKALREILSEAQLADPGEAAFRTYATFMRNR